MSDKKISNFAFLLIFSFLLPLIIISFFSSPPIELDAAYKSMWAEGMISEVSSETFSIIINNLFVAFVMCLFSIIPFLLFGKKYENHKDFKHIIIFVTIAYILYFTKEGVRAGLGLLDFSQTSYAFGVFVLTLPHGLLEIAGFAIAGSAIFHFFKNEISSSEITRYLILSIFMIITAGVLETTLTPYLFRTFI